MTTSLYDVLGVKSSASEKDIRAAYRKLAKELHPDLNPGDAAAEERFKEVSSAFAILGDSEKRKQHDAGEIDEAGQERPQQQYYRQYADSDAGHRYDSATGYSDFVDLGDIFADAFGNRSRAGSGHSGTMQFPGPDLRYHLAINFLDAADGTRTRVTMPDGVVLDVSIPSGIRDGQTLRLKGKGQAGLDGGPPGDALVTIEVRPHELFERDGDDIIIEVPIGLHEAILGGKVEVPTIAGRVNVTVPKGAKSGQTLRLRGRGIKTKKGSGDHLVRLNIVMPETIDNDLATFTESWMSEHGYDARKNWKGAV